MRVKEAGGRFADHGVECVAHRNVDGRIGKIKEEMNDEGQIREASCDARSAAAAPVSCQIAELVRHASLNAASSPSFVTLSRENVAAYRDASSRALAVAPVLTSSVLLGGPKMVPTTGLT